MASASNRQNRKRKHSQFDGDDNYDHLKELKKKQRFEIDKMKNDVLLNLKNGKYELQSKNGKNYKSIVWNHMKRVVEVKTLKEVATKCNYCKSVYSLGSS